MSIAFSYLVAVHNEEAGLPSLVARLCERLAEFPGSEVILCENGSKDESLAVARRLAAEASPAVPVRVTTTTDAGLGHGLAMGMEDVLARQDDRERWIVLTAADLPFDFSDLDQFLAWREKHEGPAVLVGSKAHADTVRQRDWKRSVATFGFRSLRTLVLRMRTHDPQGTFFVARPVAEQLLRRIAARNYFFTTELVYFAERAGIPVIEVPVVFAGERRASTVRIWKHGRQMAKQTLALRLRDLRGG